MALKLRRGTDAERQTITPEAGELIYTTDTKQVYIGDGTTQGGLLVSAEVSDDTTPQLGGDLDLNNNDIIGAGNINITGNIHATGNITAEGNITLGNGAEDNVIVGGQISSALIPKTDKQYDLGAILTRWRNVYAGGGIIDGSLDVGTLVLDGNIIKSDSSVIYDGSANLLDADLTGSVFSDDSTVLVDGINSLIVGDVNNSNITTESLTANDIIVNDVTLGVTINSNFSSDDHAALSILTAHDNNDVGSAAIFARARGTLDSPSAVNAGDELFNFVFSGTNTSGDTVPSSFIIASADPNGTVGTAVPGKLTFLMVQGPTTLDDVEALTIDSNGLIGFADNTLSAGANPGEVDDSAAATYLKIEVDGTEYAIPLFAIRP